MPFPSDYSFTRYLLSKKSLDDRSLNLRLWQRLQQALPPAGARQRLRVLEAGGGVATMATRLFDAAFIPEAVYTLVDEEPNTFQNVGEYLESWAGAAGARLKELAGEGFEIRRQGQLLIVRPVVGDIFSFIARPSNRGRWDLLMGHAVLDLFDLESAVPALLGSLRKEGLFYFTLNFDGVTVLEPVIDLELDTRILEAYHQSMDDRQENGVSSGDRYTGRRLHGVLTAAGAQVIGIGSSDWVVWPQKQAYPADESYFLHFIVETIHETLGTAVGIAREDLAKWTQARHAQIDRGELLFMAHQLDYLGRF